MIDYKELYPICGAKPSPVDERDYPLTNLIPKADSRPPLEFSKPVNKDSVLNQGNIGCCVACSAELTRNLKEIEQSNDYKSECLTLTV